MHHLIMGGPASNGPGGRLFIYLTILLPRTLCLAVYKTTGVGGRVNELKARVSKSLATEQTMLHPPSHT